MKLTWKFEAPIDNIKPALKGFDNDNLLFMLVDYGTESKEDWQVVEPKELRGQKVADVELFKSCVEMNHEELKKTFSEQIKACERNLLAIDVLNDVWKNICIERELNSSWIRSLFMRVFFGENKDRRLEICNFKYVSFPAYKKSWDFYMKQARFHLENEKMIIALMNY